MDIKKILKNKVIYYIIISVVVFVFFGYDISSAATLQIEPNLSNISVGDTITLSVMINSEGIAVNNTEALITFPNELIEVISINKNSSVFTIWVEGPSFSNNNGVISFNAGLPTPGFNGTAGKIINIVFLAKKEGIATVLFSSAAVRANDGLGTDVLSSKTSAKFVISPAPSSPLLQTPSDEEKQPAPTPGQPPIAPVVSSPTHPDKDKWYPNNTPEFNWKLPSDVIGVSLSLNKNLTADPDSISDGLIDSKKYEGIEDGILYFHIKFKNQYGWGDILHRKVLIDTVPPEEFQVTVDDENDPTNPTPIFLFQSKDSVSGIDYYEIKVGDEIVSTKKAPTRDNPYRPSPLPPEKYTVEVKAFDKAGNSTLSSTSFEISCAEVPKITKIPISINIGEKLMVEGEALAGRIVRVYIQKTDEKPIFEKTEANKEGKFSLSYEKVLSKGDYVVWAQTEDEREALSCPTKKYSFEVGLPPFLKIGKIAISYLTMIVTLIILIVGIAAIIYYFWYRITLWRKRVKKETKQAIRAVLSAFQILKKEVREQVASFDRKPGLSVKEKEIRNKLNKALKISEESIKKEIKDIEKELKGFNQNLF